MDPNVLTLLYLLLGAVSVVILFSSPLLVHLMINEGTKQHPREDNE